MKIIIEGKVSIEGEPSQLTPPNVVAYLEDYYPAKDSRMLPLMAAVRGSKFGQIPDILDRFKIQYEV